MPTIYLVLLVAFSNVSHALVAGLVCCTRDAEDVKERCESHFIANVPPVLGPDEPKEIDSPIYKHPEVQYSWSRARYISSVGWLFSPHQAVHQTLRRSSHPTLQLSNMTSQEGPKVLTLAGKNTPTTFQSLPTEIHFHIAAHLPDHAIAVLARSVTLSKSLRKCYEGADPRGRRGKLGDMSREDCCIWLELQSRDLFESTPYPRQMRALDRTSTRIWEAAKFYCFCCKKSVGPAHFPVNQMLESVNKTGMSKITDRRCFAHITPVQLWDDKVVTWDRLQEALVDLRTSNRPMLLDWDSYNRGEPLQTGKPRRCLSTPHTLTLDRTFTAQYEATAKYFIDMYTPLRFRAADASIITKIVKQRPPYICPHLDLSILLDRVMVSRPIDFCPQTLPHDPALTVADVLVATLDKNPWSPDMDSFYRNPDRPLRKVKEQAIWCGFRGDMCRTSVKLQRLRDDGGWTVGWTRDLIRQKVVRKWRVDQGTGDGEWQAQNGVSVLAKYVVRKKT